MRIVTVIIAGALTATAAAAPQVEKVSLASAGPLALVSARVSLEGTSNIHAYTASTATVQLEAARLAAIPAVDLLDYVLQRGALAGFDVVIPAASLSSPKDGIDKNMHKALKVEEYPDIRFRLATLEPAGEGYRASGLLTIAGVEREVMLALDVQRSGDTLRVTGETDLLMTDYGVKPPRAMLGMLRTSPKVRILIELVVAPSLT